MLFPSEFIKINMVYTFVSIGFLSFVSTLYEKIIHYSLNFINYKKNKQKSNNLSQDETSNHTTHNKSNSSKVKEKSKMKIKMQEHIDNIEELETKRILTQ